MRLPRLAVEHHRFTLVVLLLVTALGLVSFLDMPRSEDPFFELPTAAILVVYSGADPEVVEALAVDPLEDALREIDELETLESSVQDGIALITAEMHSEVSADDAYDAVQEKLAEVRPDLPAEVRSAEAFTPSLADVAVLQLALLAPDGDVAALGRVAEELEDRLERVPGVQRVETSGWPEQEVRVALDPERMRALGVSVDRVAAAVRAAGADIPGGTVAAGARRFNVRTSGEFRSLEEIAEARIAGMGSRILQVRDVAEVRWDAEDEEHRARWRGTPAVWVTVVQREGSNIFQLRERLDRELEELAGLLPAGVSLETVFDQSESVDARIGTFFGSLLQGILLVGVVMFLVLGVRSALLVMATIPLAILLALAGLDLSGWGLQQMSIVGLVIALGLLVDDAIVVVENIGRLRRLGRPPLEAALEGTAEVAWPSASGTVTTVLAFLPMVAIQSGTGDYIRSLPVTVIYALLASLLLSLTLTPLMASWILRRRETGEATAAPGEEEVLSGGGTAGARSGVDPAVHRPGWLQDRLQRLAEGPYRRSLRWSLEHPGRVGALALGAVLLAAACFPLVGVSLFPKAEKPYFLVDVETPDGTGLDATDSAVRWVEEVVAAHDPVVAWAANAGADNPQVYYNVRPRQRRSNIGQLLVELDRWESAARVVPALQARFDDYPAARITVTEFENGPPVEAPIVFKILGPELPVLDDLANRVEEVLRATPGTRDVRNPLAVAKTDVRVTLHRDRLALLGLDPATVDRTVRAAVAGLEVSRYRPAGEDDVDVVLRFPFEGTTPSLDHLERVTLVTPTGAAVPLGQVAELELADGTSRVDHYDTERVVTVTAHARVDASVLDVTRAVRQELEALEWPAGYRWLAGGTFEEQQEGFAGMLRALLVAVLGILAVLVLQFRSFLQPLVIFAAVPLSFLGAVGALLLTGHTFSFTAFIGITSLVGIVINNSIILVDLANRRREAGDGLDEALLVAGATRFQPIVLTTLTTVSGLLPLALSGSSMWSPLGWTIIGGLFSSMALTLVVVPTLYRVAERAVERVPAPGRIALATAD
jgi:multidrug efflux pump subunit AcrB